MNFKKIGTNGTEGMKGYMNTSKNQMEEMLLQFYNPIRKFLVKAWKRDKYQSIQSGQILTVTALALALHQVSPMSIRMG